MVAATVMKSRLRPGTKVFGNPFSCIEMATSRVNAVSEISLISERSIMWSSPSFFLPFRREAAHLFQQRWPYFQLDGMTLAVVETNGFDLVVAGQCPGQASGGVLAAAEQYQRAMRERGTGSVHVVVSDIHLF